MKTKKILGTLALAALAAACSNEEFEAVNNSPALNGRVELGQISLTVGDAETRWTVGEGSNFNNLYAEEGDEVGACLVDAPNNAGNRNDVKYNYGLTDYISTNYSFKKGNGTEWVSEAKMVEGNYVFYAPYNANHNTRESLKVKFNPVQQLAAAADGSIDAVSAIKELKNSGEIMAVSHKFIAAADGRSVSTNLLPIYAYPLVTLKNNYEPIPNGGTTGVPTDVVVNQVVIKMDDGTSFSTEGTLIMTATAGNTVIDEQASNSVAGRLSKYTYWLNSNYPSVEWDGEKAWKNGYNANYTADVVTPTSGKTSSAIVVKAPQNAWTLKAGQSTQFHVVMPAAAYTGDKILDVQVCTNVGVFSGQISGRTYNGTIGAGKRYPKGEYNSDGSLIQPAEAGDDKAGDIYTVILRGVDSNAAETVVATTEDLVTLISNAANNASLTVKPLSSNVKVNSAVVNAFKAKSDTGFKLIFTAAPTIEASISTNKTMEFKAGAVINGGTVTLGRGVTFTTGGKLNVKAGSVTVEGATFTTATVENNGGTIALKSAITSLKNVKGSVSVPNVVAGELTNAGGSITLGDGNKDDSDAVKIFSNTIKNNKGTLTISANTKATIVNNGTYTDDDHYTAGTITNNGDATVTSNVKKSSIDNYSKLTVGTNSGTIVVKSSAAEITTSNVSSGVINNTMDAVKIAVAGSDNQEIYYEFTSNVDGRLIPQCSTYNTVILNGITWAATTQDIDAKIVMKDATISVYDPVAKLNLKGGVVTRNSTNNYSYMKGHKDATVKAAGSAPAETDLVVTGVTPIWGVTSGW